MNPSDLHVLLRYDPSTGRLFRRATGRLVREEPHNGYTRIEICGKRYRTHRVVWALHHGVWSDLLDHIDHDRTNNRIENLRECNAQENSRNARRSRRNVSGVTGVSWDPRTGRWYAKICVGYKQISLGTYDTFEEAVAVRKAAEQNLGFHPNHGS